MKRLLKAPLFSSVLALLLAGALLLVLLPKADFSVLENRPLARLSFGDLSTGVDQTLEHYLADHFPGHDALVQAQATISAFSGLRLSDGVLIGRGGWLLAEPLREETAVARAALQSLREAADTLEAPLTLLLVPTSALFGAEVLPPLYENSGQAALIRQLNERSGADTIIDTPALLEAAGDAAFYRTDHHLSAEGTWQLYLGLCEAWSLTPQQPERFRCEGFLGSYWAKQPLFTVAAEPFSAWLPEGISLRVDGVEREGLLDEGALDGRNKYAALLAATYGTALLTNPSGSGRLVLLCDSYANALAPLLAQHFAQVELIDPRYFSGSLQQVERADRVLACFGLPDLSENRSLLALE